MTLDFSMINFPSLYFWVSSKACSCIETQHLKQAQQSSCKMDHRYPSATYIFPAKHCVAACAVYVSHCVQASHEVSIFFGPQCDIHPAPKTAKVCLQLQESYSACSTDRNGTEQTPAAFGSAGILRCTEKIRSAVSPLETLWV